MSKQTEALLQSILEELRVIRVHLVPAPLPEPAELERDITRVLGCGPEDIGNRK